MYSHHQSKALGNKIKTSNASLALQLNIIQQLPMTMSLLLMCLITTLPSRIHSVIRTLREAVLALSIVRDDGAVHSARVIGRNAPDHDAIGARGRTVVHTSGDDGELQIGFGRVREAEVLVVVVGVRVFVSA